MIDTGFVHLVSQLLRVQRNDDTAGQVPRKPEERKGE
jgi:hypothetical protein